MATGQDFSKSITEGSDEVKDIFCEPCKEDGRQTEAEGFCVDCVEYLCGQCYKNHKLFKAFRNHVIQDKGNMPQMVTGVASKDVCITKCNQHTDNVIEYFCLSCDRLGCTACITLDHRHCEKVELIPKIVKDSKKEEEFLAFFNEIEIISKQVKEKKNVLETISGTFNNLKTKAKTELSKQRAKVNKLFDDMEKEMDNTINEIDSNNTAIITAASKELVTMDKELEDLKTRVRTKQDVGQSCEAFIAMKQSATDIQATESPFQKKELERAILKYKLGPSTQIENMMKNINEVCSFETETLLLGTRITQATGRPKSPSIIQETTNKTKTRPDAAKLKSLNMDIEINISTSNDRQNAYARGSTLVHNNYIVVADRPNNSVKTFDSRNKKLESELVMDRTVWSVTKVNDYKVAIGMKLAIQFVSVSKTGTLSKGLRFDTEMSCYDVVHSDEKLIVAQGACIEILDMQGKVLKTIASGPEGEQLFTSCFGLAISRNHETIYISDNTQSTVISLTLDGKVKALYSHKDLKNPWGMAVDDEDNIYVCSCGTKSIHRLSADLTGLQILPEMSGGSITYTDTNKLIVGGDRSIRIYDIQ